MTDSRDRPEERGPTEHRPEEPTKDDGQSWVPRASRKRRGLRVPVDDVPRQSFVDLATVAPARSSSGTQAASTDPGSVEVSVDAEVEVEVLPPPPAPRSQPPPPPPPRDTRDTMVEPVPARGSSPPAAERAGQGAESPATQTAAAEPEPTDASDLPGLPDLWAHAQSDPPPSRWEETTKVGKRRSSTPPEVQPRPAARSGTPAAAPIVPEAVPEASPEAGSEASAASPGVEPGVDVDTHQELRGTPARASRPPPRPSQIPARRASEAPPPEPPRGLFAGNTDSAQVRIDEGLEDTRLVEVEELSAPARAPASWRPSAPPPPIDAGPEAAGPDADREGSRSETPSNIEVTAPGDEPAPDLAAAPVAAAGRAVIGEQVEANAGVEPPRPSIAGLTEGDEGHEADTSEASGEAVTIEVDDGEPEPAPPRAASLPGAAAPAPEAASEAGPAVVTIAPVVVVQRAVAVAGSLGTMPERTSLTTPGGFVAPTSLEEPAKLEPTAAEEPPTTTAPLELVREEKEERWSDPALELEPSSVATELAEDDAEILVEEPTSPPAPVAAKAPPAPPPVVSKPPAPPPPKAPPTPAQAPPQAPAVTVEERPTMHSRPPKKKPQWWEEFFNDDYLRTVPVPSRKDIGRQCDFIEQRLGLAQGAAILDVGCGLGLHAIELTRRGFVVVGLDLSLPMLSRAADEAQDQGFKINFLHADMREMNFEGAFDAVLLWGTTLGYFDDDTNRTVLERVYRALKPGGLLLIEAVNRDYAVRSQPNLVWFQGDGCVVMEETSFNFIASRLVVKRNVILDDGRQKESHYSIRLYALHELGLVLHKGGFRVVEVSGRESTPGIFFGADSPKLIILAERRMQAPQPQVPPAPPKKAAEDGPRTGEAHTPGEG